MSKYEKPITDNLKEKANNLYLYLKGIGRYATKEEIGDYLGVKNERSVRDIIALLATKKPIISNSFGKGYKLAQSEKDLEEVDLTWAELTSRMEELEKRIAPLIAFREKYMWDKYKV